MTTKVWFTNFEGEDVRKSLLESMKKLQTDYLDLVFIHWPYGNTYRAYRELEKMYEEGLIRSIGISNYQESQYVDLIHFNKVVPVVNQIKITLRCQRKQMNEVMKERGTLLQGYQVFGKEETLAVYEDEKVKEIALKYHKTTRPMQKQWMKDNLNLFDFTLNELFSFI